MEEINSKTSASDAIRIWEEEKRLERIIGNQHSKPDPSLSPQPPVARVRDVYERKALDASKTW
jgi:hypothetical protein